MKVRHEIAKSCHFVGVVCKGTKRVGEVRVWRLGRKVYCPQAICSVTSANGGGLVLLDKFDNGGSENSFVAVVTKLADGEERFAGESGEDVGKASAVRERW